MMISKLKIVKVTNKRAWTWCPFHKEKNNPSLAITLQGQYRGRYRCFGCGKWGQLSEQQLQKLNLKGDYMPKKLANINWIKLAYDYQLRCDIDRQQELADLLDVHHNTLSAYGCGWDGKSWTFPMYNEFGAVIGIQRRFADGTKLNVEGSSGGVFDCNENILFITEGLSDALMLYDMGCSALGRQNCNTCDDIILNIMADNPWNPIIVADNDKPGINGANNLQKYLKKNGIKSEVFVPPYKDVRDWVKEKGKSEVKKEMKELLC